MSSSTAQGATPLSSGGGAWTLRSQEGRLYLFNNQEKKEKDGEKNEQVTAGGVELSRLLAEKNGESCVSLACACQCIPFQPPHLLCDGSHCTPFPPFLLTLFLPPSLNQALSFSLLTSFLPSSLFPSSIDPSSQICPQAVYYHHFPLPTAPMGLYCEVDNPHMVPVTPSTVDKYKLCKKPLGDDSGWILHLDAVFLVLQEDPPNDPIINAVEEVSYSNQ